MRGRAGRRHGREVGGARRCAGSCTGCCSWPWRRASPACCRGWAGPGRSRGEAPVPAGSGRRPGQHFRQPPHPVRVSCRHLGERRHAGGRRHRGGHDRRGHRPDQPDVYGRPGPGSSTGTRSSRCGSGWVTSSSGSSPPGMFSRPWMRWQTGYRPAPSRSCATASNGLSATPRSATWSAGTWRRSSSHRGGEMAARPRARPWSRRRCSCVPLGIPVCTRACGAADPSRLAGHTDEMIGRFRGCRLSRRGDRHRGGGDRDQHRALHVAEASSTARE